MKNKMIIGGTILMLVAKSALGAGNMSNDQGGLYRASELSLDVVGTASVGKYTLDHFSVSRVKQNTRLGAGLGLNYFFSRNVGIGADVYSEDTSGPFVDSAEGNLILRFPLGQSGFAPYGMVGGGYQFDLAEVWFAQAGGGIEYRFSRQVGVFIDGRWVVPEKTQYFGVFRLGMRLAF